MAEAISSPASRPPPASVLVAEAGGSYAAELGIDLQGLNPAEIYRWFLAALLYGAPIPQRVASRTWHAFEDSGVAVPESMIAAGWDGLVAILDRGGYVRYDYKTATKLLDGNRALLDGYAGNLNALHAAAAGSGDLERRIEGLGKGVGEVTAAIFLREMRGRWDKARPPLSPLAWSAARALGYLTGDDGADRGRALACLLRLWEEQGMKADRFYEFESALVREGSRLRHDSARHRRSRAGRPA